MALPRNEQRPQRLRSVPLFDNLHLGNSFEDNGVSGQQVLDLLMLEDDVFQRCLSAQRAPTALQRTKRGNAHLLRDFAAAADLPLHSARPTQLLPSTLNTLSSLLLLFLQSTCWLSVSNVCSDTVRNFSDHLSFRFHYPSLRSITLWFIAFNVRSAETHGQQSHQCLACLFPHKRGSTKTSAHEKNNVVLTIDGSTSG